MRDYADTLGDGADLFDGANRAAVRETDASGPVDRPAGTGPNLASVPGVDELLRVPTLDNRRLRSDLSGLERRYGPFHLRLTDVSYFGPTSAGGPPVSGFRINAAVLDDAGRQVGRVERHINVKDGRIVVFNAHMRLDEGARGQGFSRAFTGAMNDYYRRSGVDRIEIFAVQDGSVAWARAGFDFDRDPDRMKRTISSIREQAAAIRADCSRSDRALLDETLNRFKGKGGYPTARDLVELAGDDPQLGVKLMSGTSWHGVQRLSSDV